MTDQSNLLIPNGLEAGIQPGRYLVQWKSLLRECRVVEMVPSGKFVRVLWDTQPLDQTWEVAQEILEAVREVIVLGYSPTPTPSPTDQGAQRLFH